MKTILILTGSPRIGGNSDLLADAFTRGATASGHRITRFDAGRARIEGCRGCNMCFKRGKACSSSDDDFNRLGPLLENANAIVLATPLYWFSFPAGIKAAIDKLYAYSITPKPLKIRESMLLACGGTSSQSDFSDLTTLYKHIGQNLNWTERGILTVPSVNKKGDIAHNASLAEAERLGQNF